MILTHLHSEKILREINSEKMSDASDLIDSAAERNFGDSCKETVASHPNRQTPLPSHPGNQKKSSKSVRFPKRKQDERLTFWAKNSGRWKSSAMQNKS